MTSRKSDWLDRLRIPLRGNDAAEFFTTAGTLVARGYTRVVIGERGPYIEFDPRHIVPEAFHIPDAERYRLTHPDVFYVERRSNDNSNVMLYDQRKTVAYADYRVGLLYISPADLRLADGSPVIAPSDLAAQPTLL